MEFKWLRDDPIQVEPYTVIAEFYDHLMEHVDYKKWAYYIIRLLKKHDCTPAVILEVACGTGKVIENLRSKGYCCIGLDLSRQMLKLASIRLNKQFNLNMLINADMALLPFNKKFDAIICLYDSINYLKTMDSVSNAISGIYQRLAAGGIFIFDICTEYNSLRHFNGHHQSGHFGNYFYWRRSSYSTESRLQSNEFAIMNNKSGQVWKERHEQIVFPVEDIYEYLQTIPNARTSMYKNYSLKPPDEKTERVHFLVEKI